MPATTLSRKLHLAICAFSLSSSIGDSFLKGLKKRNLKKKKHPPTAAAMHHHGYSFCEIHIKHTPHLSTSDTTTR
jgi:hypothetical protein